MLPTPRIARRTFFARFIFFSGDFLVFGLGQFFQQLVDVGAAVRDRHARLGPAHRVADHLLDLYHGPWKGDVTPVFQAILEKAHSVCRADMGSLFLRDGDNIRAVTTMGYDEEIDAILRQSRPPMPAMVALIEGQRFHHLADLKDDTGGSAQAFSQQFRSGSRIRTNLIIPLRKDSTVLGFISANRREVRPYSDK